MLPALDDRDEFPELSKPDRKAEKDAAAAKIKVGTAKQVAILKVKELAQMKHKQMLLGYGSSQKFDLELISRQDYRAKYAELRRLQKSAKTLRNNVDDKKKRSHRRKQIPPSCSKVAAIWWLDDEVGCVFL